MQVHTLLVIGDVAVGFCTLRQVQPPKGEGDDFVDVGNHLSVLKIEQHDAGLPGIRGMAEGELQAFFPVGHLVKIPFFYAQRRGLDIGPAVYLHRPGGPPRMNDAAAVQHTAGRFELLLMHKNAPPYTRM